MNQQDNIERIRKRELRALYRTKRMEQEQAARKMKAESMSKEARINERAIEALREDNKKSGKPDKKPGQEKFLEAYSYIPSTGYDSRYRIPPSWKPQSFNERKQHLEFLKSFVYPYPLPETLLWATHAPEYISDTDGSRNKSPYFVFIRFAKKWIRDIASGESFYKQNKMFFTKAEAHYFSSSKIPYADESSVIKLYFYAKCRARSMNHKMSKMAADVFAVKFSSHFKDSLVEGFLDLLGRTPEYRYEKSMLGDISDFILAKMRENKEKHEAFSFSGRTITSVIKLANEWHEYLRREAEANRAAQRAYAQENLKNEKHIDTSKWKGMGISQFRFDTEECIWTVTELLSAQDLLDEGRKMKNCVASYAYRCALGETAIFSVEQVYPVNQIIDKIATLEVNFSNRSLVQAKGKCNTALSSKVMNVITRWAQTNRIKVGLVV
jgi:hypothetical protein